MTDKELNTLLSDLRSFPKETEWLEYKVNNHSELGSYISALSNSACIHNEPYGYIVFGIDDESHRVVGTDFNPSQKGKGNEDLIPWLSRLLSPRIHFESFSISHSDGNVVVFRIKATTDTPVSFKGVSYVRIGSYNQKLSDYPEKERLIWTKSSSITFEKGLAIEEVNKDTVLKLIDYQSYFVLTGALIPSTTQRIIEKLLQEKIIISQNGKYSITNLGGILFSREGARIENLERKAVRVIVYDGKNRRSTIKEQLGQKGYATGFKGLIDFIDDQLPSREVIEDSLRKNVKVYPKLAIRELVANALIHQDFAESGTGPMIEIFSDRIEITNPGKPLISPLRFVDHNPQSRNEKLAHFMRRLNICEERGSGIDKVLFECELYQLPAPKFMEGDNYTRVIMYSSQSLRQFNKDDKVRTCYLHSCLKVVSGEYMTNQTLRNRFGISDKNYSIASRIISETIKSGLIKDFDPTSNSKKHAKYVPFWV